VYTRDSAVDVDRARRSTLRQVSHAGSEFSITPRLQEGQRVLILEGELDIETASRLDNALDA
jgi:hypothetical protein